jgi:hypothetical protein
MVAAIECNGLHEASLNNAAYALGCVYRQTGDRAALDSALGYARRAVRLNEPERRGGECAMDATRRDLLSNHMDTLRELHEIGGDRSAALATAQRALDVLEPSDPDYADRKAVLERLSAHEPAR